MVLDGAAGGGAAAASGSDPASGGAAASGASHGASGASSGGASGALASSGGSASWRDSLPEDIRAHSAISSFQDVASLTKSYIHAQSIVGKKGAVPPADWAKATAEERSGFFKAIGMPEADKYEVTPPKDAKYSVDEIQAFKSTFAELGILPHQANELIARQFARDTEIKKASDKEKSDMTAKQLEELKKEWGDGFDSKVAKANLLLKDHLPPEFSKYLVSSGHGNDVNFIRAFAGVAEKFLSEDHLREGGVGSGRATIQELKDQAQEILANGSVNGFFDKNHPNHDVIVRKYESIWKQTTGGR